MGAALGWVGEFVSFLIAFLPTWLQIDRNELALKHKGFSARTVVQLTPGIRWYWPAFSQIEGPFKVVWQPLTTSTINVMDRNQTPVAARGFAVWRITDLERYAVEHDDAAGMLDDLICSAIRDVITAKSLEDIQGNSRQTTNNALLREVKELTDDLGIEIQLVRLTTFTTAKMICVIGDEAPGVIEDDPEEE